LSSRESGGTKRKSVTEKTRKISLSKRGPTRRGRRERGGKDSYNCGKGNGANVPKEVKKKKNFKRRKRRVNSQGVGQKQGVTALKKNYKRLGERREKSGAM